MRPVVLNAVLFTALCPLPAAHASTLFTLMAGPLASINQTSSSSLSYPIVDTDQTICADQYAVQASCPSAGADFYGQDSQYAGNTPSYALTTVNGETMVTDNVTGLMWQKSSGDSSNKKTYAEGVAGASSCSDGGYTDWRLPTIKELYSLILFSGTDGSGCGETADPTCTDSELTPFINTNYFNFSYGDPTTERYIDAQYLSSTDVKGGTGSGNDDSVFGVNFADGRIKGYPKSIGGTDKTFYVIYVRGNTSYGANSFANNSDGKTVTDSATGLQWMKVDSGDSSLNSSVSGYTKTDGRLNWQEALDFCENLNFATHTDWRLPNAKELQSIVDYTRTPSIDGTAAIDPFFSSTSITNEAGETDWPYYWTSTTHQNYKGGVQWAAYLSFGRAMGNPSGSSWVNIHGAGAQRSDPKYDDGTDYSNGHGPQKDAVRIYNYVRCVRNADA